MTIIARESIDSERDGFYGKVEPKDAATLIVLDHCGLEPKVLLGKRHKRHVFMPEKFVFPGGRVEVSDRMMPFLAELHVDTERKLLQRTKLQSANEARALVLAAIRKTFEETGLVIGAHKSAMGNVPAGPWTKFVQAGYYPDPSIIHFIARAVTPPGFPKRFDARFFCVDAMAIACRFENVVHSDAELVELAWLPIAAAKSLDLPIIVRLVLDELESRLNAGFARDLPVPFYKTQDNQFIRELIQ